MLIKTALIFGPFHLAEKTSTLHQILVLAVQTVFIILILQLVPRVGWQDAIIV